MKTTLTVFAGFSFPEERRDDIPKALRDVFETYQDWALNVLNRNGDPVNENEIGGVGQETPWVKYFRPISYPRATGYGFILEQFDLPFMCRFEALPIAHFWVRRAEYIGQRYGIRKPYQAGVFMAW